MDSAEYLHELSLAPDRIRNFCMVAHVDHGKTTLSDYLVASNGILSPQLAGKVRLLDSRPDEQERLITMKASSITLRHVVASKPYLMHLVDSPGHIDFSCEVSTAVRLCDGALVIVDLVDGVTTQTRSMLRNVYREGLSMVLVLNKADLLITRQQLTAEEAYYRMRSVIETCNATLASYANQLKISNEYEGLHLDDPSDDVWFCPTKGNVIFSSCFDGWGFTVDTFASIYEEKLGIPNLGRALWGAYFLDAKNKRVVSGPKKEGQPPLALQLILEPMWQLHKAFLDVDDEAAPIEALVTMCNKIGVPERVWNRPRLDMRQKLSAVMAAWLPLAKTVLDTVCNRMRSPVAASQQRLPALMPEYASLPDDVRTALLNCSSAPDAPPVAFISKLIDTEFLAGQTIGSAATGGDVMDEHDNGFIGFARVYSGRLHAGQVVVVHSGGVVSTGTIRKLFLLRGLGLEEVPEVCSGCLCGIAGLTPLVTKFATVSTRPDIPAFAPLSLSSTSIVRLSVHPKDPTQLQALVRGLHILNKVDPQVEISILPTGEHVIGTAGEVHAERCIKDLVDTFARIELVASEPIVSFRETVVAVSGNKVKPLTVKLIDGCLSMSIVARPLPREALELMEVDAGNNSTTQLGCLVGRVAAVLGTCEERKRWADVVKQGVLAWGTSKYHFAGSLLMTSIPQPQLPQHADAPLMASCEDLPASPVSEPCGTFPAAAGSPQSWGGGSNAPSSANIGHPLSEDYNHQWATLQLLKDAISAGFLMASAAGSMAEEPLFGVALVITELQVELEGGMTALSALLRDTGSSMHGQVMVSVRDACRKATEQPGLGRRLVEPIYHCVVYSSGVTQGKIYAILSRRRSEILEEVPNEGCDLFYVSCYLPAVEAFGLQDELRIATHGAATAQLEVHHWGIVDADPYYKPTTREDLEEHGAKMSNQNIGASLLERIRRRKGIHRDIVVESAEKQKFSVKGSA